MKLGLIVKKWETNDIKDQVPIVYGLSGEYQNTSWLWARNLIWYDYPSMMEGVGHDTLLFTLLLYMYVFNYITVFHW